MIDYSFYISQLNLNRLSLKDSRKWNAECPLCDDSSVRKHRLWFMPREDVYIAYCHNAGCEACNGLSFGNFLKRANPTLHKRFMQEYKSENFKDMLINKSFRKKAIVNIKTDNQIKFFKSLNKDLFKPLTEESLTYLKNRGVPNEIIKEFLWCDKDRSDKIPYGNMVILPLSKKSDKTFYGFTARCIVDKKFIIKLADENNPKIYNLYNVDNSKNVYIIEGMFDSFFVENSIACLGASINKDILSSINKPVFIYDNDKTGLKQSISMLESGYKCVWIGNELMKDCKDINDLVVKQKLTEESIMKLIKISILLPNPSNIMKLKTIQIRNKWN